MNSGTQGGVSVKKHQSENEPHGQAGKGRFSPEYRSWRAMRKRCFAKVGTHHGDRYAARGIQICEAWDVFTVFLSDMGPKPAGSTLERKNNDLGYNKDNCVWATNGEQSRNRSSNRIVEINGTRMCLKDAAKLAGLKYCTVWQRLKSGWSIEEALSVQAVIGANQALRTKQ